MASSLAEILASEDPDLKVAALRECGAGGKLTEASRICDCLSDRDALVRGAAAGVLASAGEQTAPFLGKVAQLLVSGDAGAKCAAAEVLGALASSAAPHASSLAALLNDSGEDTTCAAVAGCSYGTSRPKAAQRVPRIAAAEALPKLGAAGRAFASAVAGLLGDRVPEVRCAAAASLGAMGGEGAAFEGALLERLESERDHRVLASIAVSVAEMNKAKERPSPAVVSALIRLMSNQHPGVRAGAARALGSLGDASVPHAGKLLKCLSDRSPQVKIAAMEAIVSLGAAGQVYAADIARLAFDGWQLPVARAAALDTLPLLGERGAAFAYEVEELFSDPEEEVRNAAGRALEAFSGGEAGRYAYGA